MRVKPSHLIAVGIVLALAGWLASGQIGAGRQPTRGEAAAVDPQATTSEARLPSVRVRDLVAEPVRREVVANGETAPARAVTVRAETSGRVVAIGPARGAMVAEGEVLVELDPRARRANVDEAEAMLAMRRIEHEAAEKLGQKGFQAETKVAAARADLEAAEAALERARIELDHTTIRAPFASRLEGRPVEIGDFVDVGDPVATVIEQDPFLVVADVAEADIGRLAAGMPGSAQLVTGRTVQGHLRYVASQADPATRTFRVELEVPNPEGRFAAGASAVLRLAYEQIAAQRVPAALLGLDDRGVLGVKAVDDDQRVVFFPADIVRAEVDAVWLAGLPERVRVITVGQGFVRAGDRVRVTVEDGAPAPGPLVAEQPT